jgi:hypothetical protein
MSAEAIGYYCPRINLLKLYGPLIAEQARRKNGLRALLLVPVAPLITYAAKNRHLAAGPRLSRLQAELGTDVDIAPVDSTASFLDVILARRVRAVVSVGLRLPAPVREGVVGPSRAQGVRWCSLGYIHEELFHILADGVGILDDWDVPTTFSQAGIDRTRERLVARGVKDADRVGRLHAVGFVECDQTASLDRRAARRAYGVPEDRPMICMATAPPFESFKSLRALRWLFPQAWYGGPRMARAVGALGRRRWPEMEQLIGYRDIVACLRRFADRHDAVLLAKTRDKHHDPGYVHRAADRVLSDGQYYPFRTLELLCAADLYVGIYSSMAFEAAFLGRRMRTVAPFPPEALEDPNFLELKRDFFFGACGAPGLWNAAGVSELSRTYQAQGWEAFRDWAEYGGLETGVDALVRSAVVQRAIGFDDDKASARFLDRVESALGSAS